MDLGRHRIWVVCGFGVLGMFIWSFVSEALAGRPLSLHLVIASRL